MASYFYKDLNIYKGSTGSNTRLGFIKSDTIYKGSTSSNTRIGSVASIKREIKDSNSVDGATIVAAYHFLIKSIF